MTATMTDMNETITPHPLPVRIAANAVAVLTFPIWFSIALVVESVRERFAR